MLASTDQTKLSTNLAAVVPLPFPTVPMSEPELIASCLPEPKTIAETMLNPSIVSDLILKSLYCTNYLNGYDLAAQIHLSFYGILDGIVQALRREELVEISGANSLGDSGYQYLLTNKGIARAEGALRRSGYIGPAPVPLAKYIELVLTQARNKPTINRTTVTQALRGMILTPDMIDQVGAVVNSGRSLFLFGAPGNGKTMLAERIGAMLGSAIAIP